MVGFGVSGFGFGFWVFGFEFWVLGFGGLGLRVYDSGYRTACTKGTGLQILGIDELFPEVWM